MSATCQLCIAERFALIFDKESETMPERNTTRRSDPCPALVVDGNKAFVVVFLPNKDPKPVNAQFQKKTTKCVWGLAKEPTFCWPNGARSFVLLPIFSWRSRLFVAGNVTCKWWKPLLEFFSPEMVFFIVLYEDASRGYKPQQKQIDKSIMKIASISQSEGDAIP